MFLGSQRSLRALQHRWSSILRSFHLVLARPRVAPVRLSELPQSPGSPFTLLQLTSSTVVATLQLNGSAYTGSAATGTTPTVGVFSTQLVAPGTIPAVLAQLAAGGVTGITYSASFIASPTNPVPEPASMLLLGLGLVGAGLVARRKVNS